MTRFVFTLPANRRWIDSQLINWFEGDHIQIEIDPSFLDEQQESKEVWFREIARHLP